MSDLLKAEIGVEVDEAGDDIEELRQQVAVELGLGASGLSEYITSVGVVENE
jgi:hypothetical protein